LASVLLPFWNQRFLNGSVRVAVFIMGKPIFKTGSIATAGMQREAWAASLFQRSKVARNGGPIRTSIAAINKNSHRTIVKAAARSRGWIILEANSHWIMWDSFYPSSSII
jgi:hypothetical protein